MFTKASPILAWKHGLDAQTRHLPGIAMETEPQVLPAAGRLPWSSDILGEHRCVVFYYQVSVLNNWARVCKVRCICPSWQVVILRPNTKGVLWAIQVPLGRLLFLSWTAHCTLTPESMMALLSAANVPDPEKQFKARGTSRRPRTERPQRRRCCGWARTLGLRLSCHLLPSPSSWDSYLSSASSFVGEEAGQAVLWSLLSLWVGVSVCLSTSPTSHILFQKKNMIGAGEITQWWRTLAILKEDVHSVLSTTTAQLRTARNPSSRGPHILFWPLHLYTSGIHLFIHVKKIKIENSMFLTSVILNLICLSNINCTNMPCSVEKLHSSQNNLQHRLLNFVD